MDIVRLKEMHRMVWDNRSELDKFGWNKNVDAPLWAIRHARGEIAEAQNERMRMDYDGDIRNNNAHGTESAYAYEMAQAAYMLLTFIGEKPSWKEIGENKMKLSILDNGIDGIDGADIFATNALEAAIEGDTERSVYLAISALWYLDGECIGLEYDLERVCEGFRIRCGAK